MTCPYKHFAKYGIRLKQIEEGGTKPADIGSFLHTVLEEFVKHNCDFSSIEDIIQQSLLVHDKLLLPANSVIKGRAIFEAKHICEIAAKQLAVSDFVPMATELEFGKDKEFAGIDYQGILMQGKIDRVDRFEDFIRLIDYKSGKADFKHRDLYLGIKLQLLLYLNVFYRHGYNLAGSFYFLAKHKWDDDQFSYQLKGVYDNSSIVVFALDRSLSYMDNTDKKTSTTINCTASLDEKTNSIKLKMQQSNAIEQDTLIALSQYASDLCEITIKHINSGFIAKKPLISAGKSPCSYCEYKSMCAVAGDVQPREFNTSIRNAHVYTLKS
jgi:ATP-dependent helicase/nuclease subunit B